MNVLDLLLIAAALGFAVSGYRQGFVVGALSVLGFLGGGLVAVQLLPLLLRHLSPGIHRCAGFGGIHPTV